MPATYIKGAGLPRLVRAGSVVIDKYGLATGTAVWWAFDYRVLLNSGIVYIGASHPYAPTLHCEKITYNDTESGATAEASYAGVLSSEMPAPIDELDTTAMQAPIESHPNFVVFAGTPAVPLNGAEFLPNTSGGYRFDQFGPKSPPGFRGVTSFEVPTSISRRTTITTNAPDAVAVGKRAFPYETFGIPGDWLVVGCSTQKRGNVYVTKFEWKASGLLGWNHAIYESI